MKKIFTLLLLTASMTAFAQEIAPYAMVKQNACATYAILRGENKKLNMGTCYYRIAVNSVTDNQDGTKLIVYRTDVLNKKKAISSFSKALGMDGGFFNQILLTEDGSYAMDQDMAYGYGKEMARGGFMFKIPSQLIAGQTLENGTVNQEYRLDRYQYTSSMAYNDVKVEREEDYTTPAGTFHCFVITYNVSGSISVGSQSFNINNEPCTIWIAQNYGIICYKYISSGSPIYFELNEVNGI